MILSAAAFLLLALILCYRWDSEKNHGYTFGYWAEFNCVSNSLAKLPGITIVNSGCNADVTLEEFGFDIRTSDGRTLKLWIGENEPIRKLRGEQLSKALIERMNTLRSSTNAGFSAWVLVELHSS
jgi:hypothetical protein